MLPQSQMKNELFIQIISLKWVRSAHLQKNQYYVHGNRRHLLESAFYHNFLKISLKLIQNWFLWDSLINELYFSFRFVLFHGCPHTLL